jgi:hypothetical protein
MDFKTIFFSLIFCAIFTGKSLVAYGLKAAQEQEKPLREAGY